MARIVKTRKKREEIFPFEKQNFVIIGVGVLLIIVGYVALLEKTVVGFVPLYVAPVLLVLGYCVIVPLGILYTRRSSGERDSAAE